MSVAVLDQEMYTEAEAAWLLRVSQGTLNYWLEGGTRRGRYYPPVIREQPRGAHPPVTWAEFVESGWLKQYRRTDRVPMRELRAFITKLRELHGVPYPLAHFEPFANQGQLARTFQVQREAELDPEFCLVAEISGQMVLTVPSGAFIDRVDWETDVAVGWRPHEDPPVSGPHESSGALRATLDKGHQHGGAVGADRCWLRTDRGCRGLRPAGQ